METSSRDCKWSRLLLVPLTVVAVMAAGLPIAQAFKPYTHVRTAQHVLDDLVDGKLTIADREYNVEPAVRDALVNWPDFYRAGVIGPDGFPDLTYGQSVIHPDDTGLWLRHVFTAAWLAQNDTTYTTTERSQILAFAYGYLMHAAGDTWAHTLVNDFALGVFPGPAEILTDADSAAIALRHIIVEGYIGDATAGFDGNRDRGPVSNGDVSDDSTDAIDLPTAAEFGGVSRFIYETLIDPTASTPTSERGPLIGFFLDLRSTLSGAVTSFNPQPIATLTSAWEDAKSEFDDVTAQADKITGLLDEFFACDLLDFSCSRIAIGAEIIFEAAVLGFEVVESGFSALYDIVAGAVVAAVQAVGAAVDALFDAYLVAWIADIDAGLMAWPEVGRASTVALFDPQARRDLQNETCQFSGAESTLVRAQCEAGIGALDVLLHEIDPFINSHLLSMLGAPDFVGEVRSILQEVLGTLDSLLAQVLMPLNPLREGLATLKNFAKELIKDFIEEAFGVDLDSLKSFLTSPTSWLNVTDPITITLPLLGSVTLPQLFRIDDHERLDEYIGFGASHHVPDDPPYSGFPYQSSRLTDTAVFSPGQLAVFDNTVTLGKLLLLSGFELDRLLGDLTGHPGYTFYSAIPHANVMLEPLPGVIGVPDPPGNGDRSGLQWLRSIDGDHAWRSDRLPAFPGPATAAEQAGLGNFPLWESCALRTDVFRVLFADWENGSDQFPDHGDQPSLDPNDPNPPTSSVTPIGTVYTESGTTYVGPDATLRVNANDDYWPAEDIQVAVEIVDSAGNSVQASLQNGSSVSLSGLVDGPMLVTTVASDPCRIETDTPQTIHLDTTGPQLAVGGPYSGPEGTTLTLDGTSTSDPGSGVSSTGWSSVPAALFTQNIDPVGFVPPDNGNYTVTLAATDNLGNSTSQNVNVAVANVSPSVEAGADLNTSEGELVSLLATFNDPGTLDTHTATIDWGDGTGPQTSTVTESPFGPPGSTLGLDGTVDGTHVYADNGSYTVTICVTDDDTAASCDMATAHVANQNPTVAIDTVGDGPAFFLPHVEVIVAATFNDLGTLDTHNARTDWGDGQTTNSNTTESPFGPPGATSGLDGSIDDSHSWATSGVYTILVTVTDDDNGLGAASTTAEVVDPSEALSRTITELEPLSDEAAIANALKHLIGPERGNAASGALHKLEQDQYNPTLVKIIRALEDLSFAKADVGDTALVLTQIAESLATDLQLNAIAADPSPSRGRRLQLDRVAALMDQGRLHLTSGRYIIAVGFFRDAARLAASLAK